jgi:MoaA/NifB/PqqE/SkfB family radical SAM enzyme
MGIEGQYMFALRVIKHGTARIRASFFERVFLKTGWDRTYPAFIQCRVSERCNYRCQYCNHWNREKYMEEMSLDEWKRSITSIKEFANPILLQFSGGEPFVYPHFVELIEFCHAIGIDWDVITNGSAFANHKLVKRVVASNPLKIDISVDGSTAEIHDVARGIEGSLARIERGLDLLVSERTKTKHRFPIRIIATVHRLNAGNLERIACWAKARGATSVNYNPVRVWVGAADPLCIEDDDTKVILNEQIHKLAELRSRDGHIRIEFNNLGPFATQSCEAKSTHRVPCRQAIREFTITPNGDVKVCDCLPALGSLRNQSAKSIWRGEQGRKNRRTSVNCTREYAASHDAISCRAGRSIWSDIQRAISIMRTSH